MDELLERPCCQLQPGRQLPASGHPAPRETPEISTAPPGPGRPPPGPSRSGAHRWSGPILSLFLVVGCLCWTAGPLLAGGWDNGILGTRAPAMGTAFVGLADDPSTIFYNPGGTALLEKPQGISATVRYNGTVLSYEFPEGRTSPSGADSGASFMMGVIPDIFYYRQFGRFSAGIGVDVPYGGLAGSWGKDTFGVEMSQLMAVASFGPSFAFAITPKLAIGAGLNIYFGYMQSKVHFDEIPIGQFLPDLATQLPENLQYVPLPLDQKFYARGLAFGYNVGILYKPFEFLSLGVAMRSGTDVSLSGPSDIVVHLEDPLALYLHSDLEIDYTLPYLVVGGVAVRPVPNLVVVADVQYSGWGSLNDIQLHFKGFNIGGTSVPFTQVNQTGYEDTVKFMVGMEYVYRCHYSGRLGYMYTPTNIKHEEALSYQSWDTTMHNFSVGFGYAWTNFELHALAMISPGEWTEKHFDDPADPRGKPAGKYTTFNQTYGVGCLWYF